MRGMNIVNLGNEPLMQVLELLADPEKFKKALHSLKSEQKRLNDRIALAGKASEILEIRGRIEHELDDAREEKDAARDHAKATRERADLESQKVLAGAKGEAAERIDSAQEVLDDAKRRQAKAQEELAEVQRTETLLVEREQHIQNMEATLKNQLAESDTIHKQLLKEKSELASVRETLKAAVG
jgi:chromosome segregation ATPase